MDHRKKIALIPAYQPDSVLIDLAGELKNNGFAVVVVDDGSSESSGGVFRALKSEATVLRHDRNLGKGAAIKTGLDYIYDNVSAPYIVITVDADGQHRIPDAVRVCREAFRHPDSLILGSRRFTGKVPLRSRLGNRITQRVFRLASKKDVSDTQTGLRAFSERLIPRLLTVEGSRYEYEMNVLMRFADEDIPMREVFIETVYVDGNSSSHFHTIRDSWRIYRDIIKFSLSSFLSFSIDYLMFCLLMSVSGALVFSNIAARAISASVNYMVNRKVVFQSDGSVLRSAAQYAMLAGAVLAGNTLLLQLFTSVGVHYYIAKVGAEILMFAVSWTAQRYLIFGKGMIAREKA